MHARIALTLLIGVGTLTAQSTYPPELSGARTEVYRTVDGVELKAWIYEPKGHRASDKTPAIVFFFGGGWRNGSPAQFEHQAKYLASRGMVAMTADYRVASRHQVTANKCVEDAKAAIRWARTNANRLGIDPNRIAAGGGSAGGHLAAATATLPGHDDPNGDRSMGSAPNALALFNPATVLASAKGVFEMSAEREAGLAERMGAPAESMSPYHSVGKGLPPAIIFHGKADTTVPYATAAAFEKKMKAAGNRCELVGYEGETHRFFNHGRGDGSAYTDTVRRTDEFFVSLGWLEGNPTIGPSE